MSSTEAPGPGLTHDPPALVRLGLSFIAGVVAAVIVAVIGSWWLIPLAFWDAGAGAFVAWLWPPLWHMSARETARRAAREDPGRAVTDPLLLTASVVSLLAVGLVLVRAGNSTGLTKGLLVGLGVVSIVLSWGIVHTVFSLRYARMYYDGDPGGVDFNEDESPCFSDFAYLALTIGMTFQVSDTSLQTKDMRRAALAHALLSYLFGALVIATTVNLIAGLGK